MHDAWLGHGAANGRFLSGCGNEWTMRSINSESSEFHWQWCMMRARWSGLRSAAAIAIQESQGFRVPSFQLDLHLLLFVICSIFCLIQEWTKMCATPKNRRDIFLCVLRLRATELYIYNDFFRLTMPDVNKNVVTETMGRHIDSGAFRKHITFIL